LIPSFLTCHARGAGGRKNGLVLKLSLFLLGKKKKRGRECKAVKETLSLPDNAEGQRKTARFELGGKRRPV